jgi:hypothetical protein
MGYPRKLQPLVIEDDPYAVQGYKSTFKLLEEYHPLVEPLFVRSYAEARRAIEEPQIFHVVLLDLNLPAESRQQPQEGLTLGGQLLEFLASREAYPIPCVVVISGKLNLHDYPVSSIQERLTNDFVFGRLVNKGSSDQHNAIEEALLWAHKYVDVGIHVRDAGNLWYPVLSPREEYLLRRCVVSQPETLGVDIRWWSAERGDSLSGSPSPNRGPTKVLMGHFLLDEMGKSRPTFFKFEPAGNAPMSSRDASILAHKLGHVKVLHESTSRQRSLIVTQSVTISSLPIPLSEYLLRSPDEIGKHISRVVSQIINQLGQLGDRHDDEYPISEALFKHLSARAIDQVLSSPENVTSLEPGSDPLATMTSLLGSSAMHWSPRAQCVHGDLNASNVAIDTGNPEEPHAYVFDAAGTKPDLDFRDLATLEVTTILFSPPGEIDEDSFRFFRALYSEDFVPSTSPVQGSDFARNVISMVLSIRQYIDSQGHRDTYAVLVFDAVMRQLSGLGLQPSPNKVRSSQQACALASWITAWARRMAPALVRETRGA